MNAVARLLPMSARRFLITGGLSYLVDTGTLLLLNSVARWPLFWATTAAYLVAFAFTFTMNRFWVFDAGGADVGGQMVRYLLLVGLNFGLTLVLVLGLAAVGFAPVVAKTIAVVVIAVMNYFVYRHFVFVPGVAA